MLKYNRIEAGIYANIDQVLDKPSMMGKYVSFDRDNQVPFNRLFKNLEEVDHEFITRESNGSDTCDYEPWYSYIANGEYGNCHLVLYRNKYNRQKPYEPSEWIFIEYSYQYKGRLLKTFYRGKMRGFAPFTYELEED